MSLYSRRVKINKRLLDFFGEEYLENYLYSIFYLCKGIIEKKDVTTYFDELYEALHITKKLYLSSISKYDEYTKKRIIIDKFVEKRIVLNVNFSKVVEEFGFFTRFKRADIGLFINTFFYLLKEEANLKYDGYDRGFNTFNEYLEFLIKYRGCDECSVFKINKIGFIYFVLFGETKV